MIAFAFILFNTLISNILKIGIGTSLLISAVRCIVQLTVVATILQQVFAAENKWVVAGIVGGWTTSHFPLVLTVSLVLLNLLGTIEIGMTDSCSTTSGLTVLQWSISQNGGINTW